VSDGIYVFMCTIQLSCRCTQKSIMFTACYANKMYTVQQEECGFSVSQTGLYAE